MGFAISFAHQPNAGCRVTADQPWYRTLFERDWYDLLAQGRPGGVDPSQFSERTAREIEFVDDKLGLQDGGSILDLCCGWGRHAIGLAQRGYQITGLDLSTYHVELARNAANDAGVGVAWIEGDMRSIPSPAGSFDAVVNLFTAFGYFDDDENQRVLEEVARVLAPGGRFLIDIINRDYLMGVFTESDWHQGEDGLLILERREWNARTGRVHVQWTIVEPDGQRRTHAHDERIYTLQEIELRLAAAGLRVLDAFGGFDGRALGRTTRRLIVLAEKS